MFNITYHQQNANQNHKEISHHNPLGLKKKTQNNNTDEALEKFKL